MMRPIRHLLAAPALAASLAPAALAGDFATAVAVNINQATAGPRAVAMAEALFEPRRQDARRPATALPVMGRAVGESRLVTAPEVISRVLARWMAALR